MTERRRVMPRDALRSFLTALAPWCTAPLDAETTRRAWAIQDQANFSWWDCLLLAAALRAGCTVFASEDLADGHVLSGMRILNPFKPSFAALLQAASNKKS